MFGPRTLASWPSILVVFGAFLTAKPFVCGEFVCEDGWKQMGLQCYKFFSVPMDYWDAKHTCEIYGSNLTVVYDEVRAAELVNFVKDTDPKATDFWITTTPSILDGECYIGLWDINQPNTDGGVSSISSNLQGRWKMTNPWTLLPFICRVQVCADGHSHCSNGSCLKDEWWCDGKRDCPDGSDEDKNCPGTPCVKHFKASTGNLDPGRYGDNANCQWILEGKTGEVLKLEITSMRLETGRDVINVYSGGPTIKESELLVQFDRSATATTVVGYNNFIIVQLLSDASKTELGIVANWSPDPSLSRQVQDVSVSSTKQTFATPYSNQPGILHGFKKEWLFTAPEGKLITVEIATNTFSQDDEFVVMNSGFRMETSSGKEVIISNKNTMRLIVKTKHQQRVLQFTVVEGCSFDITLAAGHFKLEEMPADIDCTWTLHSSTGRKLLDRQYDVRLDDTDDYLSSNWTSPTLTLQYHSSIVRGRNVINFQVSTGEQTTHRH